MNLMNLVVTVRSDCEGLSLPIFRKTILKTEVSVTDDESGSDLKNLWFLDYSYLTPKHFFQFLTSILEFLKEVGIGLQFQKSIPLLYL